MLMVAYEGEGSVKNPQSHAYVIYGWPPRLEWQQDFQYQLLGV